MSIARESFAILALLAIVSVVFWWFLHPAAVVLPGLLMLFTAWFFRDPERAIPDDPGVLVSPADGKIIKAGGGRVSIFMNVFNVHVCRAPEGGSVQAVEHVAGRFLAAFRDDAPEMNERASIDMRTVQGDLRFTLIAGLIARRIVCKVAPGRQLVRGERVGLIQFGSRVDVVLPDGVSPAVALGQKVRAGETIIARRES